MLETYPGILRANQIEWEAGGPKGLSPGRPVRVHITLLETVESTSASEQGRRMAVALDKLAASRSGALPTDPAAWEREAREDRSLPDRDE